MFSQHDCAHWTPLIGPEMSIWHTEPIRASSQWMRGLLAQSVRCVPLCDPMNCSTPGFPVLHHIPELAQPQVFWVGDASVEVRRSKRERENKEGRRGGKEEKGNMRKGRKRQEAALRDAEQQGLFSIGAGSVASPPEAEGPGIVLGILYTAQTSLSSGLSCSSSSDPLPQAA